MIVILGSRGMAGHMIGKYLICKGHNFISVARDNADIIIDFEIKKDVDELIEKLLKKNIKYIINCVGLLIQNSEKRPDKAIWLNSWLPKYLEYRFKSTKIQIIHISTDCVFNGKVGAYIESDIPNETNIYGRTKALGEINNNKDITFRTSIIGPEIKENGSGLLYWFLKRSGKNVNGWNNVFWNGVTTLELAKCITKWIENPNCTGIYHLSTTNKISKLELLKIFNDIYKANKIITNIYAPDTLDKTLIDTRKELDFQVNDYETQLKELKDFQKKF